MKRLAIGIAVIAALGAVAAWAWLSRAPGQDAKSPAILRVASQKGGTKSLMLAAGVLKGAPYRVEWSEFPSAQALLEALGANAVDMGQVGDAPYLFAYGSGLKIKAAEASIQSGHGSSTAVIVPGNSALHDVRDLRGKRIATGRGSIGHYVLLRALERAGLAAGDVKVVYMNPADAKAAFASGAVDGWATWGPYVGLAVLHDRARVLVDGQGILSGIGFEAVNNDALARKHDLLVDFLRRLRAAERWSGQHQEDYAVMLARETGLPPDVTRYVAARSLLQPVPIDARILTEERQVADHFTRAGILPALANLDAAFDTSFNTGTP